MMIDVRLTFGRLGTVLVLFCRSSVVFTSLNRADSDVECKLTRGDQHFSAYWECRRPIGLCCLEPNGLEEWSLRTKLVQTRVVVSE